jgi:L-asparaginase II
LTVVAEVVRNDFVESVHHGRVVAIDGNDDVLLSVGDVSAPIFPRSAMKPLQTLGMLRAGWMPVDDEQLAIACASHSGEDAHLDVVRRILASAGLDESVLDNVPGLPLDEAAARALLVAGGGPDRMHQNCSGKHAGMLAACVANGWPTESYRDATHPLQVLIRETVEDIVGETVSAVAVDGCGAPLFAVSCVAVARAFRRLVTSDPGTPERRVADAMRAHPFVVGGTGRDVTTLMTRVPGLLVKDGAEGVCAAASPDDIGVAMKIDDGAGRARTPVLVEALRRVGVTDIDVSTVTNAAVLGHGRPVGVVRAAF